MMIVVFFSAFNDLMPVGLSPVLLVAAVGLLLGLERLLMPRLLLFLLVFLLHFWFFLVAGSASL